MSNRTTLTQAQPRLLLLNNNKCYKCTWFKKKESQHFNGLMDKSQLLNTMIL